MPLLPAGAGCVVLISFSLAPRELSTTHLAFDPSREANPTEKCVYPVTSSRHGGAKWNPMSHFWPRRTKTPVPMPCKASLTDSAWLDSTHIRSSTRHA